MSLSLTATFDLIAAAGCGGFRRLLVIAGDIIERRIQEKGLEVMYCACYEFGTMGVALGETRHSKPLEGLWCCSDDNDSMEKLNK